MRAEKIINEDLPKYWIEQNQLEELGNFLDGLGLEWPTSAKNLICFAAEKGYVGAVNLMMQKDPQLFFHEDKSKRSAVQFTPLECAVSSGQQEVVDFFIQNYPKYVEETKNNKDRSYGCFATRLAITLQWEDIAIRLIDNFPEVINQITYNSDHSGVLSIHAVIHNCNEVFKFIIAKNREALHQKCSVSHVATPIEAAAYVGNSDLVRFIENEDPTTLTVKGDFGFQVIRQLISGKIVSDEIKELIRYLMQQYPQVLEQTVPRSDLTILDVAAEQQVSDLELFELLAKEYLRNNKTIHVQNSLDRYFNEGTLLDPSRVKILLENGANITFRNIEKRCHRLDEHSADMMEIETALATPQQEGGHQLRLSRYSIPELEDMLERRKNRKTQKLNVVRDAVDYGTAVSSQNLLIWALNCSNEEVAGAIIDAMTRRVQRATDNTIFVASDQNIAAVKEEILKLRTKIDEDFKAQNAAGNQQSKLSYTIDNVLKPIRVMNSLSQSQLSEEVIKEKTEKFSAQLNNLNFSAELGLSPQQIAEKTKNYSRNTAELHQNIFHNSVIVEKVASFVTTVTKKEEPQQNQEPQQGVTKDKTELSFLTSLMRLLESQEKESKTVASAPDTNIKVTDSENIIEDNRVVEDNRPAMRTA